MLCIKHCLGLSFNSIGLLYSTAWLQIFCCMGHQTIQHDKKILYLKLPHFASPWSICPAPGWSSQELSLAWTPCVPYWTKNKYFCKQNINAYIREILSWIQYFISKILQAFSFDSATIFQLLTWLVKPFAVGTKPQIFTFLKKTWKLRS